MSKIIQTNNTLVSIVVLTYNSSKYILETLESIKAQSYKNIELIISDDCSCDETVKLCQNWLTINSGNFVNHKLLKSEVNTGTVSNCNRGLAVAQGVWVKYIGGDDILLKHCIEENVQFLSYQSDAKILISDHERFNDSNYPTKEQLKDISPNIKHPFYYSNSNVQFLWLMAGFAIYGGALFFEKKALHEIGGFDPQFRIVEDRSILLKYAFNGIQIYKLENKCVLYRQNKSSVSAKVDKMVLPKYEVEVAEINLFYARLSKHLILILSAYIDLLIVRSIFTLSNKGIIAQLLSMTRHKISLSKLYVMSLYKLKLL